MKENENSMLKELKEVVNSNKELKDKAHQLSKETRHVNAELKATSSVMKNLIVQALSEMDNNDALGVIQKVVDNQILALNTEERIKQGCILSPNEHEWVALHSILHYSGSFPTEMMGHVELFRKHKYESYKRGE